MNARELTEALGGKWRNNRGTAYCPAHRETTPSFSIWQGADRARVHCFAGCSFTDILHALKARGIRLSDPAPRGVKRVACAQPPVVREEPQIDCDKRMQFLMTSTSTAQRAGFAKLLGVSLQSLERLQAALASDCWAFPMRDGAGKIIGIRLRFDDGRKLAVKGSHAGLIYEPDFPHNETVWITEGPTDCAAALTLGLPAIGRPSCRGQEEMICVFLKRVHAKRVIIIADDDTPGRSGADVLMQKLTLPRAVFLPPAKDIRQFVNNGGTADTIRALTSNIVWTMGLSK